MKDIHGWLNLMILEYDSVIIDNFDNFFLAICVLLMTNKSYFFIIILKILKFEFDS